jgi:hypothetical protein
MENVKKTAATTASKVGEAAQETISTGAALGGLAMHSAEQRRQEMLRDWDKERAVSEKGSAHGRKEAAKSALEHHFEAKDQALAAAHLREDAGVRTAEENISGAASAVSGAVSSAAGAVSGAVSSATGAVSGAFAGAKETAKDTFSTAADVSKLAAEAALEQKAAAQESFYKGRATQESLTAHARKEAAKNALEAHIERKEHAQEKARIEEDLGVKDRIEQAKESIVETAGMVKEKVAETIPKVTESASQAAATAADYAKSGASTAADYAKSGASTAADYAKSGASTAADYAKAGASRAGEVIIPYLQAAKENVSAAAAATAHLAMEKKHEVQEGWARSKAEDENASAHDRKEAAKAALEHHLQAQSHASQTTSSFGEMISSVATAAYQLPANIYNSLTGAATVAQSTAAAATHKTLEAKETMQEKIAQTQAVSEAVPSKQRMESAKAALEHHEAAIGHANVKEMKKKEAGLDTVGDKISEAYESAKEQTSNITSNVTGTVKATFQSVGQKTHELQESYYKNQAIAENKAPADRMDAAKKAIDHHVAAAKTS